MEQGEKIEDPAAAEEAAYAEKPARDYLAEYKEQLTPEAQQALAWIASAEGKKALENYEADKNAENPVTSILREKALKTLEFDSSLVRAAEDFKSRHIYIPDEWASKAGASLKRLGESIIEDILSSEVPNIAKMRTLGSLGDDLLQGALTSIEGPSTRLRGLEVPTHLGNMESYNWGFLASEVIARGQLTKEYRGVLMSEANPKHEMVLKLLNEVRSSYPENDNRLDRSVEECGYIWDSKQNKYLKL